LYENAL